MTPFLQNELWAISGICEKYTERDILFWKRIKVCLTNLLLRMCELKMKSVECQNVDLFGIFHKKEMLILSVGWFLSCLRGSLFEARKD